MVQERGDLMANPTPENILVVRTPIFEQLKKPCVRFSLWWEPQKMSFPEHRHLDKWELVYLRSGTLRHSVNGKCFEQHRGDFTLIRECDRHSIENIDGEAINISISPEYYTYLHGPRPNENDLLCRVLDRSEIVTGHVPSREVDSVERELTNLIYQQGGSFETVYFCSFFFRLMASYVTVPVEPGDETFGMPDWLSSCLAWFDRNRECPISIKEIQHRCNRTPEYICRCFRKYLGVTPSDYVNQRHMAMAEQLLLESDKTAEEIGWAVGYTGNTYFFRVFKQTYGISPNAYRHKYRPGRISVKAFSGLQRVGASNSE